MDDFDNFLLGLGLLYYAAAAFFIILWTLLPFAIFGLKKRLELVVRELDGINRSLSGIHGEMNGIIGEMRKDR